MAKRVLWLSNNTEQRKYEVPRLILAGYEVYCPKICGYGLGESYLSVTDSFDSSLSLDPEILELFDRTNFYCDEILSIMDLINSSFDMVFVPPFAEVIRRIVHHFRGTIILRWLGDEDGLTCTERIIKDGGYSLLYQINRIKDRFYFAYSSEWEIEDECDVIRGRSLFMPLPMTKDEETEVTAEGKGLLICPNIRIDESANKVFRLYQQLMKDDFKVLGEQLVPPENHKEIFVGNGVNEQKKAIYNSMVAVDPGFKSTLLNEPWRQIISAEKPLLFTKGSKAEKVLGKSSPGYCKDEKEVQLKYKKILKGDKKLAKRIIDYQNKMVTTYSISGCNFHWDEALATVIRNAGDKSLHKSRKKRIGIILPVEYLGGVLSFTLRFVSALKDEIQLHGDLVELVFAHAHSETYKNDDTFIRFREEGIPIREITVVSMKKSSSEKMLEMAGFLPKKWHGKEDIPEGVLYNDDIHMLMDCDYLINMTDRSGGDLPTHPLYPYAVIAHDYLQRYIPLGGDEIFIPMARNADKVFVTSVPTYEDALQYTMVGEEKLVLLPLLFDLFETQRESAEKIDGEPYFVWSTNVSKHKNHINALKALNEYYKNGGSLKCHITGYFTHYLNPQQSIDNLLSNSDFELVCEYIEPIRKYIQDHSLLKNNICFDGYLQSEDYSALIKNACYLFHPGYGDNGNGAALDSASLGIPTLSNDYPAMRYLSDSTEINCQFVNINNIGEASKALQWMQDNWEKCASELDLNRINKHSIQYEKVKLYERIASAIGFGVEVQK